MMKNLRLNAFVGLLGHAALLMMLVPVVGVATTVEEDMVWTGGLRNAYFGVRPITQSADLIVLDAPARAEDAAIVPISITAQIPQTNDRYIKTIYLIIDKNPGPLIGTFRFTHKSPRRAVVSRNGYSP